MGIEYIKTDVVNACKHIRTQERRSIPECPRTWAVESR